MKNTFNKLIVDANCKCLNSEFSRITHHTQNGFTGGRNFLKKIDLDASGRIYSCAYEGRFLTVDPSVLTRKGGDFGPKTAPKSGLGTQDDADLVVTARGPQGDNQKLLSGNPFSTNPAPFWAKSAPFWGWEGPGAKAFAFAPGPSQPQGRSIRWNCWG